MTLFGTSSNVDERTRETIQSVASKLYFITIGALSLDMLYRQIFLKQTSSEFEDIAIVVTFNTIVFLVAVFWKGGVSYKKIRISAIVLTYLAILILGSLLGALLDRFDTWTDYVSYMIPVGGVSTILIGVYIITAILGNRRIDRMTADDEGEMVEETSK